MPGKNPFSGEIVSRETICAYPQGLGLRWAVPCRFNWYSQHTLRGLDSYFRPHGTGRKDKSEGVFWECGVIVLTVCHVRFLNV